jgi:hypothetical protein
MTLGGPPDMWCRAHSLLRSNKALKSLKIDVKRDSLKIDVNRDLRNVFPPFLLTLRPCYKRARHFRVLPSEKDGIQSTSKPRIFRSRHHGAPAQYDAQNPTF